MPARRIAALTAGRCPQRRRVTGDAHFQQEQQDAETDEPLELLAVALAFLGLVLAAGEAGQVVGIDLPQVVGLGSGRDVRAVGGQGDLLEQLIVALGPSLLPLVLHDR